MTLRIPGVVASFAVGALHWSGIAIAAQNPII
jgi:hypothetical protein